MQIQGAAGARGVNSDLWLCFGSSSFYSISFYSSSRHSSGALKLLLIPVLGAGSDGSSAPAGASGARQATPQGKAFVHEEFPLLLGFSPKSFGWKLQLCWGGLILTPRTAQVTLLQPKLRSVEFRSVLCLTFPANAPKGSTQE